jgi:hypothetical protein
MSMWPVLNYWHYPPAVTQDWSTGPPGEVGPPGPTGPMGPPRRGGPHRVVLVLTCSERTGRGGSDWSAGPRRTSRPSRHSLARKDLLGLRVNEDQR